MTPFPSDWGVIVVGLFTSRAKMSWVSVIRILSEMGPLEQSCCWELLEPGMHLMLLIPAFPPANSRLGIPNLKI